MLPSIMDFLKCYADEFARVIEVYAVRRIEDTHPIYCTGLCSFSNHVPLSTTSFRRSNVNHFYIVHSLHYDKENNSYSNNKCTILQFMCTVLYISSYMFRVLSCSLTLRLLMSYIYIYIWSS